MASRKIIWSKRARIIRLEILKYYIDRNKSNTYSIKLNRRFNKELLLLIEYPNLGIKTDIKGVRGLIIENFGVWTKSRLKTSVSIEFVIFVASQKF